MTLMFTHPNEFSQHIEGLQKDTDMTLLETILQFCEDSGIDPEDVVGLISKSLKDKIGLETGLLETNSIEGF